MIAGNAFLEWADVFGNLYGTCAHDADAELVAGRDLVLVIDVQGARQVRSRGIETVSIFVLPPSFEILEQRLRGRSKDSEEAIRRRLATARAEVDAVADYDYVVVNDEVEPAVQRLKAIVEAERSRLGRMKPAARATLCRVGPVGHRQDHGGRATGPARPESRDVPLLHLPCGS